MDCASSITSRLRFTSLCFLVFFFCSDHQFSRPKLGKNKWQGSLSSPTPTSDPISSNVCFSVFSWLCSRFNFCQPLSNVFLVFAFFIVRCSIRFRCISRCLQARAHRHQCPLPVHCPRFPRKTASVIEASTLRRRPRCVPAHIPFWKPQS